MIRALKIGTSFVYVTTDQNFKTSVLNILTSGKKINHIHCESIETIEQVSN